MKEISIYKKIIHPWIPSFEKGRRQKCNKAFSLIELIVVISIMATISISWFAYFLKFNDDLKFNSSISNIKKELGYLDNKVLQKEIFDYELFFIKDKKYYYWYENIFDLNKSIFLDSFDEGTWIWVFAFSWANSGTWVIRSYKDIKFQKEEIVSYNWSFNWDFEDYSNYRVTWSISWEILNSVYLNYLDDSDLIKLVWIDTDLSSNLNSIKITNVLWKKTFWDNDSINKIILTFENIDWKLQNLEILK